MISGRKDSKNSIWETTHCDANTGYDERTWEGGVVWGVLPGYFSDIAPDLTPIHREALRVAEALRREAKVRIINNRAFTKPMTNYGEVGETIKRLPRNKAPEYRTSAMLTKNITTKKNYFRFLATATNTVDQHEIEQFKNIAAGWWDEYGDTKPLHSMNKLRVPLIRDGLVNSGLVQPDRVNTPVPLKGLSILDIGCGGGILSEPLARLGADVTGIDAYPEILNLARSHASQNHLDINYVTTSIEDHALGHAEEYDAVVASEIIEHVSEKSAFVEACTKCLKPNGSIFVTTLNKTRLAEFVAVFLAEDLTKMIPKGTHQYEKLIEPHKLQRMLEDNNCRTVLVHGMFYNFVTNTWHWCSNTSVDFALHATKFKKPDDSV